MDDELTRRAASLRTAAIVVAAVAGSGLGIALALIWRLHAQGQDDTALVAATLTVLVLVGTAFTLVQSRAVANLLDRHRASQSGLLGDLERRLLGLEAELAQRPSASASNAQADGSADAADERAPEARSDPTDA